MQIYKSPIHVVIGANYGDEGKGLVTNYLSHVLMSDAPEILESMYDFRILNVRYNGGAQAGHTVYQGSKKHVFGHFGAGSLIRNVDTYLTADFIVNPMLFHKERESLLHRFHVSPTVYVSDHAIVTTPFDIMKNQVMEKLLALDNTHKSSVGVGIFQTILRNRDPRFALTVGDYTNIAHRNRLHRVLRAIADNTYDWYEEVITKEIKNGFVPPKEWVTVFSRTKGDILIENSLVFMRYFHKHTKNATELSWGKEPVVVLFEGAQGLALSECNMHASNFRITPTPLFALTPSYTGVDNVIANLYGGNRTQLWDTTGEAQIHLHYVTRAYFTRHGKGPFPSEFPTKKDIPSEWNIRDSTNSFHEYQGTLRIGLFDVEELILRIKEDLQKVLSNNIAGIHLHVNFLDQTNNCLYVKNRISSHLRWVEQWTGRVFASDGKSTTENIRPFEDTYEVIPHGQIDTYLRTEFLKQGITLTNIHFHSTASAEQGHL